MTAERRDVHGRVAEAVVPDRRRPAAYAAALTALSASPRHAARMIAATAAESGARSRRPPRAAGGADFGFECGESPAANASRAASPPKPPPFPLGGRISMGASTATVCILL